ncbi:MAG: hypothetical protein IJD30_07055 [Clostridia bacterium]|nr:hypothetical protein [Clostridia bacterium]
MSKNNEYATHIHFRNALTGMLLNTPIMSPFSVIFPDISLKYTSINSSSLSIEITSTILSC